MKTLQPRLMFGYLFLTICIARSSAASLVSLRYLDFGADIPQAGAVEAAAADIAGNLFTITAVTKISGRSPIRVIKTDPQGNFIASFDVDVTNASESFATSAATDAQGNLVIAGVALGPGFPLVSPLFPSATLTGTDAFVMKLDSNLNRILFSTLLSNNSSAGAVATDASGNIYIAGQTSSPNFPITPGAYQTKPPDINIPYGGQTAYAFMTEISPNGDRLLYSTYFGGDQVNCPFDPSVCIFTAAMTAGTSLAIAPSGAIVMAGSTSATDLPVDAIVASAACYSSTAYPAAYIAVFAPGGARLEWGACLGATEISYEYQPPVQINALAIDATGAILVAGSATGGNFPTTTGVAQPALPQNGELPVAGFIAKLNSSGTGLLWSTYFGEGSNDSPSAVKSLAVDPQGAIVATGYSDPTLLPPASNVPLLGDTFTARLSSDGTTLENLYIGPNYATGWAVVLTPSGTFMAEGQNGCMWIESQVAGPSLLGTANAAGGPVANIVSPSELISLYGIAIGSATALPGQVKNGVFASSLGGYQVLFDGIAAPLLYVGPTQINTIVPMEVAGQDQTHIQIVGPSGIIDGPTLALRPSQPEIFRNSQTTLAAALNQDGSVNSPQNPAQPGSIVSIFSTGNGVGGGTDGQLLTQANLNNSLPVAMLAQGTSLDVLYAGDAPGLVSGVFQINFRLPNQFPPGNTFALQLQVGDSISQNASIAITQ